MSAHFFRFLAPFKCSITALILAMSVVLFFGKGTELMELRLSKAFYYALTFGARPHQSTVADNHLEARPKLRNISGRDRFISGYPSALLVSSGVSEQAALAFVQVANAATRSIELALRMTEVSYFIKE